MIPPFNRLFNMQGI